MITTDGKKMIKTYKNDYIKSQLKYISSKILNAVEQDHNNIHLHGYFDKDIEVILRNLGYTVHKSKDENNEWLEISWEEIND